MSAEFRYEPLASGRNPDRIYSRQPATDIGGKTFLAGIYPPEGDRIAWPSDEADFVDSGPNAGTPEAATHGRYADLNFLAGREAKAEANLWTPVSDDPPGFFIWSVLYGTRAVRDLSRKLVRADTDRCPPA
jgi:hypothetical protein